MPKECICLKIYYQKLYLNGQIGWDFYIWCFDSCPKWWQL